MHATKLVNCQESRECFTRGAQILGDFGTVCSHITVELETIPIKYFAGWRLKMQCEGRVI